VSTTEVDRNSTPIVDSHIHLFDPRRPQGIPWPTSGDTLLYRPALPRRYEELVAPLGVVGAIVVEASPWIDDNQWVLDLAADNPMIVGTVGNLDPGAPDFGRQLERFHRNPLFLGIRYGNLWDRDLGADLLRHGFIDNLRVLAKAGLVLDSANPDTRLLEALVRLTDRIPDLRVIADHLPQMTPPSDEPDRAAYFESLSELANRPQVYVKISEVLRRVDGRVPLDLSFYREQIDRLWDSFGPNRVLFGSDWPNSDQWAEYGQVTRLINEYLSNKDRENSEKFFWRNSIATYRWQRRTSAQQLLV
jgi:L-fuconolactonase